MRSGDEAEFDLLADLLDLPAEQRAAALLERCDDTTMRHRLETLLAEYDAMPANFLGGEDRAEFHPAPDRIGRFRIIREIGVGGMGVVYEAEQDNPRRLVALKVIRPGSVSPQQVRRFEHEAQILGRLQHPGIAQVYEAGTARTPFGDQPYFAMELVEGLPLDTHARERGLSARERLALMARVCDAVHSAHQRGIVHRDLKPANIVVVPADDSTGAHTDRPMVLDFGVARITDAGEHTLQTEAGQLIGTLTYMSPEQVTGASHRVDARSDIYALGVVLYELLTGAVPLDVRGLSVPEAAVTILDEEPSRLGHADTSFRGDIETIVAKALEKDPDRRYASAGELAEDIRRFLADEPIIARAPSRLYQIRKFTRRNKVLVAGALATAATLLAGTGVASFFAIKASGYAADASRREAAAIIASRRAHLAAAQASSEAGDITAAAAYLDRVPPAQRGWEWRVIRAGLDRSEATAVLPERTAHIIIGQDTGSGVVYTCQQTPEGLTTSLWSMGDLTPRSQWRLRDNCAGAGFTSDGTRIVARRLEPMSDFVLLAASTGEVLSSVPISPGSRNVSLRGVPAQADLQTLVTHLSELPEVARPARVKLSDNGEVLGAMPPVDVWVLPSQDVPSARLDHPEGAGDIAFDAGGRWLATAGRDRTIRFFDLEDLPEPIWTLEQAHDDAITSIAISPDGTRLATGSEDRAVRVWDAASHELLATLLGHTSDVTAVAFTADGRSLLSADATTMKRWDLSVPPDLSVLAGHSAAVNALAVSPDGALLASGADRLCLWDIASRERVATIEIPSDGGNIASLEFTPDGRSLHVQRNGRDAVVTWSLDLLTGQFTEIGRGIPLEFIDVVEPSGVHRIRLAGAGNSTSLLMGDRIVHDWPRLKSRSAAFGDDGTTLAIASTDIMLYDLPTDNVTAVLAGHTAPVHALAFQPGGRRLASGSEDRTIRVWGMDSRTEQLELRGHLDRVRALVFSPDGSALFSGAGDMRVRVWETRTTAEVLRARAARADLVRTITPQIAELLAESSDAHQVYETWNAAHQADPHAARVAKQMILQYMLNRQHGE